MTENQTIALPQFIQDILDLGQSHNFSVGGPENVVGDGENVISDMTLFEQACYISIGKNSDQAKKKVTEGVSDEDDAVQSLLKRAKMSKEMMWLSIRERLDGSCPDSIGIRDGWKIVARPKKEDDCNCPACQLKRAVSGSGGVTIFGVGIGR